MAARTACGCATMLRETRVALSTASTPATRNANTACGRTAKALIVWNVTGSAGGTGASSVGPAATPAGHPLIDVPVEQGHAVFLRGAVGPFAPSPYTLDDAT